MVPLFVGNGYTQEVTGEYVAWSGTYNETVGLSQISGYLDTGQNVAYTTLTGGGIPSDGSTLHFSLFLLSDGGFNGRIMGVFRQHIYTQHYLLSDGRDWYGDSFGWGTQCTGAHLPPAYGKAGLYVISGQTRTMTYCSSATTCASGAAFTPDYSQPADTSVGIFSALPSAEIPYGMAPVTNTRVGGYSIGFGLNSTDIPALASSWFNLMKALGRIP